MFSQIIKKYYTTLIPLSIIGFGIACVIGYLINKDIFRVTAIDQKYCYYIINDSIAEIYATENTNKAYQVISYYYCDVCNHQKGILMGNEEYSMGKNIMKVEILKYTSDSLLAKIRYKYHSSLRGGMIIESEGYVPKFSLHDTVPSGYDVKNLELMQ